TLSAVADSRMQSIRPWVSASSPRHCSRFRPSRCSRASVSRHINCLPHRLSPPVIRRSAVSRQICI
ncbi:unnamed protein product, partial [Citrullus colocynthis]